MKKVYLFTDGSFIPSCCTQNKSKVPIGAFAYVFNHNGKARAGSAKVAYPMCPEHIEAHAIITGINAVLLSYTEPVSIVIITDCKNLVDRINDPTLLTSRSSVKRKRMLLNQYVINIINCNPKGTITAIHTKSHVPMRMRNVMQEYNNFCDIMAKRITRAERTKLASFPPAELRKLRGRDNVLCTKRQLNEDARVSTRGLSK